MKPRFKLYRRKLGGRFYVQDNQTNKQESLNTKDRDEAVTLLHARNEAARQPQLNLQIAKAYLAGTDSGLSTRTWQNAFNAIIDHKSGSTKERWQRGSRQKAFGLIHRLVIVETQAEQLFACLRWYRFGIPVFACTTKIVQSQTEIGIIGHPKHQKKMARCASRVI